MLQRSRYHLILDRSEPDNPRWVIAKECLSRPATTADRVGDTPDTAWLAGFGHDDFTWLNHVFGRDTGVRVPGRGGDSHATRLEDWGTTWTEYTYWIDPDDHDS